MHARPVLCHWIITSSTMKWFLSKLHLEWNFFCLWFVPSFYLKIRWNHNIFNERVSVAMELFKQCSYFLLTDNVQKVWLLFHELKEILAFLSFQCRLTTNWFAFSWEWQRLPLSLVEALWSFPVHIGMSITVVIILCFPLRTYIDNA